MKIAIIGGGGRVGACAAFALQCSGIAREILILDANQAAAEGEALDLLHGSAYCADQRIAAGNYADCADADIVCITAGLRRKPDESRLDLINRNVALFLGILDQLKAAGLKREAIVFVVSNPVDILTKLAAEKTGLPPAQVLGLGTVLDTSRFCSLIASSLDLPATQVRAMILGEHGDTMLPVWSSATVDGFPLLKFPGVTPTFQNQIFERTQKSGAEVIVSTCPMCTFNIDHKQMDIKTKYLHFKEVPVLYFTQLLGLALGLETKALGFELNFVDPLPLLKARALL